MDPDDSTSSPHQSLSAGMAGRNDCVHPNVIMRGRREEGIGRGLTNRRGI